MKVVVDKGILKEAEVKQLMQDYKASLQAKLDDAKKTQKHYEMVAFEGAWSGLREPASTDFSGSISTKISKKSLKSVLDALVMTPESFKSFSKLERLLKARKGLIDKGVLDWGLAEQLAFGSLLLEEHSVRLSGQDCRRGTFSHRHAYVVDYENDKPLCLLDQLKTDAKLCVYNSHLAEYAVMGFEYGMSMAIPKDLVIWEAQFGDFSNGAQIIIDQFISAAQSKWRRFSGLTLLLPHGYEGQGPEHSSARLERYLQLCAQNNMYVANPTTPANYFHLLRRQVHNAFRIPLVVVSPKSLLRHPKVQSPLADFTSGGFEEVIASFGKFS